MKIHTDLTAPNVEIINEMFSKWKEKTKYKQIDQTVLEQPINDGDYKLHIYYDDGRKNIEWTEGGNSIKK